MNHIYYRDQDGLVRTDGWYDFKTESDVLEYHQVYDTPYVSAGVDYLMGWPDAKVEWYIDGGPIDIGFARAQQ